MRELSNNDIEYIMKNINASQNVFKDGFEKFDILAEEKGIILHSMFSYNLRFFLFEDDCIIGIYSYTKPHNLNSSIICYISNIESEEFNSNIDNICRYLVEKEDKRVIVCVKENDRLKMEEKLLNNGFDKEIIYEKELVDNQDIIQYVRK